MMSIDFNQVPLPPEPDYIDEVVEGYETDLLPDPEARTVHDVAYEDLPDPDGNVLKWGYTGFEFLYGSHNETNPIWGDKDDTLWQQGEAFMICADPGIGKTTIAMQLVEARMGLRDEFLGLPVVETGSKVLYLACDRPSQIGRSFRRMWGEDTSRVSPDLARVISDKLVMWKGPLRKNILQDPAIISKMCEYYGADTVIIDSVKDVVHKLSDDEAGNVFNSSIQTLLQQGREVVALHHNRKPSGDARGSSVRHLSDVYGSVWLTAGFGSVVSLEGLQGDGEVKLKQLKAIANQVEFDLSIDFASGRSVREHSFDPLVWLASVGSSGASAYDMGSAMCGSSDVPRAVSVKAKRELQRLESSNLAVLIAGRRGGSGGGTPDRWVAKTEFVGGGYGNV